MHGATLLSKASNLDGPGGRALWLAALLSAMLAACATAPEPPAEQAAVTVAAPPPAAPPAIVVLPFNEAVKLAATELLSKAPLAQVCNRSS